MYLAFFGFREKPFNLTPDPKFLYLNASYREALAALHYGVVDRKGFVSLIGEAGTGKTTLLRRLLSEIPRETLLSDDSLEKVEKTEAAYRSSIDELELRARPRLENATSPLLANTREKLLVLDAAIAECRREFERNQLNTHLRRELLAMYVEKTKTLQGLFPESNGDKS